MSCVHADGVEHIFLAAARSEPPLDAITRTLKAHVRVLQVLVVSVPTFATTNTTVLVNMRTLEAQPIDFSCKGLE